MTVETRTRRRLIPLWVILVSVAAAFVFSIFVFLPRLVHDFRNTLDREFGVQFLIQLAAWLSWAILAPLILALGRRVRRARMKWPFLVPAHLASAVAFLAGHSVLYVAIGTAMLRIFAGGIPISLPQMVLATFNINVLVYGLLMSGSLGFDYYRELKERESKAARLEARLALSRLQALKIQIHPHFLFNTLNGISALISIDPESAETMIGRLSELLRWTLGSAERQEISLKEELEVLDLYLDIMAARYKDRLTVSVKAEPGTEAALVPSLVLQPLVENAIRYGIAPSKEGGPVEIRARSEGGLLVLTVSDRGPGFPENLEGTLSRGVGINNTKARLRLLYGEKGRITLGSGEAGGARVTLEIPYHTAPNEASGPGDRHE